MRFSAIFCIVVFFFFFFNDTATTEIYTLSLHDALPISAAASVSGRRPRALRASLRHQPGSLRALSQRTAGWRPALYARLDFVPPPIAVPDLRRDLVAPARRQCHRRDARRWLGSGPSRGLRPAQSLLPGACPAGPPPA